MQRHGLRPGRILWEVQEAYQPGVVKDRLPRGPLEYSALWKAAQRLTDRPLKFGAICAPALASMLWDEYYGDDRRLTNERCDIMTAEFRERAAGGCPLIQVEEPPHHGRTTRPDCTDADLEFLTQAFNRQLKGVDAEIWVHTCWGNPNQQRVYWEPPSYERALPSPSARRRRDHVRVRQLGRPRSSALRQVPDRQEDRHRRGEPLQHGGRAARARGRADPQGAGVHPAGAAGDHDRLRIRSRGAEPADRVLQVRRAGRRH